MLKQLEHDALGWIKTLAIQPAGFRVIQARPQAQLAEPHDSQSYKWDWIIDAAAHDSDATIRLLVEVKSWVTPQTALTVLARMRVPPEQGVPLLVSPTISPRLRQLCEEYAISYLDGAGNCHIVAPGLYIERRGLGTIQREKSPVDLFATKASRIVRAMLSTPAQGWQVQRLARWDSIGVSLGLASKLKHALLEQGFAVERDRLLYVRNPDDLLKAWLENYRLKVKAIPLYVSGDPFQAEAAIAEWCLSHDIRYGLTQLSGAWRIAPAVRYQRSTIYVQQVDDDAWENLHSFSNAKRVSAGANVVLWQTYDPAVFLGERRLGDPPLNTVSALQLFLDLKQLRGRGDEAAQAVYDTELAPSFASTPHRSE